MLWPQGPEDRNSTRFTCMGVQPPHCRGYGAGLQPADEGSVAGDDRTGERGVRRSGRDRCTGRFTAVRTGLPRRRRDHRNTEVTGFSEHRVRKPTRLHAARCGSFRPFRVAGEDDGEPAVGSLTADRLADLVTKRIPFADGAGRRIGGYDEIKLDFSGTANPRHIGAI